jgi:hypothetical protein
MNPAMNAGVSGGLAGALVTILNSWFIALHLAPMTADVATAYAVMLTAGFGYFFHVRSLPPLLTVAPASAVTPAAAVALLLAALLGSYLLFGIAPASAAGFGMPPLSSVFVGNLVFAIVIGIALAIALRRWRVPLAVTAVLMLAACAGSAPGGNSAPLPPLPQIDPVKAMYYLQAAGCITAEAAAVAAPIVQASADGAGNAVLAATAAGATVACKVSVPLPAVAAAAPAPAPSSSP